MTKPDPTLRHLASKGFGLKSQQELFDLDEVIGKEFGSDNMAQSLELMVAYAYRNWDNLINFGNVELLERTKD